jgi:hypothetical protein
MTIVYHISHSLSTAAELHVVITLHLFYPTLKWVSGTSGQAISITSYNWGLFVNTGPSSSIYIVIGQVSSFDLHREPVLRNRNSTPFVYYHEGGGRTR